MIKELHNSYSVIGNLSREGQSLRLRSKSIVKSLLSCKNKLVLSRLRDELKDLEHRREEILSIASSIKDKKPIDILGLEFLIEICSRPVKC